MVSVASGGTVDRIAARILVKVLRAGCGTPARYSSTFFGAPLPFAVERRLPDFTFFMGAMLRELPLQVHAPCHLQPVDNFHALGGPEVLKIEEGPIPEPGKGEGHIHLDAISDGLWGTDFPRSDYKERLRSYHGSQQQRGNRRHRNGEGGRRDQ